MATIEGKLDASGLRVTVVVSRFNEAITGRLLAGARDCLSRHGADDDAVTVVWVPGSWELPQVARKVASPGKVDAVIALGALVRGETPHFDILAAEVAKGLAAVADGTGVPVIFGVLTTDTVEQALDRAGAKAGNKGWEAALSAIEMVDLFRRLG
jgi:6,7-dimethyl-8-ribityllumazine synthase